MSEDTDLYTELSTLSTFSQKNECSQQKNSGEHPFCENIIKLCDLIRICKKRLTFKLTEYGQS